MKVLLLGPPGAGNEILALEIAQALALPYINLSDLLKDTAAEGTELGKLVNDSLTQGRVSDDLSLSLLKVRLGYSDIEKGYVLVDFPRTLAQAEALRELCESKRSIPGLILIRHLDMDRLLEKLAGDISCRHCGAEFNLYNNPPMVENHCDDCGAKLKGIPVGYEETVSNKLRVYETQIAVIADYFSSLGKVHHLPAATDFIAEKQAILELIAVEGRKLDALRAAHQDVLASEDKS